MPLTVTANLTPAETIRIQKVIDYIKSRMDSEEAANYNPTPTEFIEARAQQIINNTLNRMVEKELLDAINEKLKSATNLQLQNVLNDLGM